MFFSFKEDVSGSSLPLTTAAAVLREEEWSGHVLLAFSQAYTCWALIKPMGSWAWWFMTVVLAIWRLRQEFKACSATE